MNMADESGSAAEPTSRVARRLLEQRQATREQVPAPSDAASSTTSLASAPTAPQPAEPPPAEAAPHAQAAVYEDLPAEVRTRKPAGEPPQPERLTGSKLRRSLDHDVEAELAEMMAQFDNIASLDTPKLPPRAADSQQQGDAQKRTVRVLSVRGDDVFVDLGEKSEGVVTVLQFEGKPPKPGDLVELIVDHFDRDNNLYILRRPGTVQEADWGSVEKGMVVDAQVKKVNKGGLEVTVNGIRGFMPAGQVDLAHIVDQSIFVGQTLRCIITEVSLATKNLIVSRKLLMEQERAERAKETLATLREGQVRDGVVRSVKDFGAFVDIGGVDGLLHVSQISWQRINNAADVLRIGQEVKVVVLGRDEETGRISLGLRQLSESPWSKAEAKYRPGAVVPGKVSNLMDFGAFVELEPGVEGLVHISELSPNRVRRVFDVVKVGQPVDVKVLEFDAERKRISLSLKQAMPEPEPEELEPTPESTVAEAAKPKKPTGPLKGGLGGSGGPMFG